MGLRVTPDTASTLLVNWEEAFQGCKTEDVYWVTLFTSLKGVEVRDSFDTKEYTITGNPCYKVTVHLILTFTESYKRIHKTSRDFLNSKATFYNNDKNGNVNHTDANLLYAGLLKEEVISKICRLNKYTYKTPEIPDSLKACFANKGKVVTTNRGFAGPIKKIWFQILNPRNTGKYISTSSLIENVPKCLKKTSLSPKTSTTESSTKSPTNVTTTSSKPLLDSKTILALSIGLPMGLTLSLLLVICVKNCRKNPATIANIGSLCMSDFAQDQNEDYGVYYSAGQRVEIASEVRDNNDDYEATEE